MKLPKITTVMTVSSLFYLALGTSLGGLLLVHKGVPLHPLLWSFLPAHADFLLWGWTTQLTLAVAYWIFPRFRTEPARGNPILHWAGFILFNLGLLLASAASFFSPSSWLRFSGRLGQLTGALVFVIYLWRRIRPYQR